MTAPNGTQAIQPTQLDSQTMLLLIAGGDTSKLTPTQKLAYYNARCEAAGLDPRTQPFEFIRLQNKETLYARKAATDGLSAKHGIKVEIRDQRTEDGIRTVTVRAITRDGRETDDVGAVSIKGLQGDALCNALMKAVTKAKRRAVLSVCGLGMLDETEVETIPVATYQAPPASPPPAGDAAGQGAVEEDAQVVTPEDESQDTANDPVLAAIEAAKTTKELFAAMPKTPEARRPYSTAYEAKRKQLSGRV